MTVKKHPLFLGVNVDHIATVRQARGVQYPDPVHAAILAELSGADGITVHLREDKRHIQPRDVHLLKPLLQTRLNLEMAATNNMLDFACSIKPTYCCLVPEKREELTTEGGLDVVSHLSDITRACEILNKQGIEVSLFIDADEKQITAAKQTGATIIELHTGVYADAKSEDQRQFALKGIQQAAYIAHEMGLQVNAGHGLHYQNVQDIAAIPQIIELNIGHAIVGHAMMVGMGQAVKQMKDLMLQARGI